MIPHLHLHLEPGERSSTDRPRRGRGARTTREDFFLAHSLAVTRHAVTAADVQGYLVDLHEEQRADGVGYVEVRLSPRRLLVDGASWEDVLSAGHRSLLATVDPVVRAVLLVNRDSPADFVGACTEVVASGLPPTFVGIDLAGDELAFPDVSRFARLFATARAAGLGATVHAGEFGPASHIWRAVDELGASRIGHGVSATTDRALVRRLARDRILVEACLTSNRYLGTVADVHRHPAFALHAAGVPVCFNADVPWHTGSTLQEELDLAGEVLGPQEVLRAQTAATAHAFGASSSASIDLDE